VTFFSVIKNKNCVERNPFSVCGRERSKEENGRPTEEPNS